jgi:ketosteroid isomerase-like protein
VRRLILGAVLGLAVSGAAPAATPDPQLTAPIQKFTHSATADLTIFDEVPPYVWNGPQAFKAWATDLDADSKKRGVTDQAVAMTAPTRVEASGDQAYVVMPVVYTFKEHGVAMREAAQMTVVLKKGAGGWLIHGWTWTGPAPKAAPPTAKTPAKP